MPQNRWAGSRKNWSEKSLVSKALQEAQGGHERKKSKSETQPSQTSQTPTNVLDAVTPWRLIPYVEQLERKQTEMVSVITRLQKAAISFNMSSTVSTSFQKSSGQKRPRTDHIDVTRIETETKEEEEGLPAWLRDSITKGALICPIESIMPVPSGTELYYRNKARFTIGFDTDNKPCVGYKVGSYSEKQRIASPIGSTNLPHEIFTTLDLLQKWLQESPLPLYDQVTHSGVWREVSVRWSEKTGEIMVDLMANPSSSSSSAAAAALTTSNDSSAIVAISEINSDPDIYKVELSRFVDCIKTLQGVGKIISVHICLQEYSGVSSPEASHPHKYLYGEKFVIEKMCGLSFAVSPGAFFQVHTPAAERLYFLARALAIKGVKGGLTYVSLQPSKREDLTILDVCCGTGTIGLVCAPFVGRVIGVDIAKEAIEDAERNKALNGETVSNAEFICGKAETLMKEIIKDAQNGRIDGKAIKEIVAIVDPPRAGLHPDVIRALRTCKLLKRVIYVSCNPTGSLAQDALKLCVPPRKGTSYASGPPFHPVHAYPFDLFPETQHCEMVMVFERGGGGVGGVEEEEKEEKREIEEKEEKREIFEEKEGEEEKKEDL